ncbi:heterokaryon incompatibility protein-domain-containing protein [Pestalotiopsis sp. NC0098]|nr:heterokaryon incompatibility protein-domain-containing protein [Pestalotiopsis sp. NC0098]
MDLCHDCRNIKLGKLLRQAQNSDEDLLKEHNRRQFLSTSHDKQPGSYLYEMSWLLSKYLVLSNLGSRLRGSQSVHCDFCALLRNHRFDAGDCSNEDDLVAIRYFEVPSGSQRWACRGTPSDLIIMAIKDSKTVPVNQPTINADELSQAIRDCHQNHQECSKKTTKMPSQPIELNLIDCRTRRLVARMSSETYVVLSYVWGGVPRTSLNSESLPRTLEDAIEVTLSLGFQYIWIDQFCVDQDNHDIKQKQIQTMGRVYEDAVVTLVAASGSDANHGLPGAPSRPREFRPEIELDGLIISQKAAPISYVVERSAWATRGWTFQEQFFSRRFLIFAPEEVSFECRRVQISSNWGTRSRGDNNVGTIIKPLPAWSKLFSTLHKNKEWSDAEKMTSRYDYFVDQYWTRRLSVEEDGINAFAAVLETLKIYWNEQFPRKSTVTEDDTIEWRMTFTAEYRCWNNFIRGSNDHDQAHSNCGTRVTERTHRGDI